MHRLIATATVAFLASSAQSASAQDLTSQIVGTWKWTGHVYRNVGTGNTANVYGEKPTGLMVFTKNGNLVYAVFGDNRLAPARTPATDAEGTALYCASLTCSIHSMFCASAGRRGVSRRAR